MRTREEINKSYKKIEAEIAEMDRISALYPPLCKYLMPIRKQANIEGQSFEGRIVYLSALVWPKQYKEGIDRCLGFDIRWTGGKDNEK